MGPVPDFEVSSTSGAPGVAQPAAVDTAVSLSALEDSAATDSLSPALSAPLEQPAPIIAMHSTITGARIQRIPLFCATI